MMSSVMALEFAVMVGILNTLPLRNEILAFHPPFQTWVRIFLPSYWLFDPAST